MKGPRFLQKSEIIRTAARKQACRTDLAHRRQSNEIRGFQPHFAIAFPSSVFQSFPKDAKSRFSDFAKIPRVSIKESRNFASRPVIRGTARINGRRPKHSNPNDAASARCSKQAGHSLKSFGMFVIFDRNPRIFANRRSELLGVFGETLKNEDGKAIAKCGWKPRISFDCRRCARSRAAGLLTRSGSYRFRFSAKKRGPFIFSSGGQR